jgi:uncharacterized membrane protein YdjX (TVP38/TMEM64 family)
MQIAIAILAILIVGAIVGSALNFAGLFLGIPIVFLFIGAVIGKEQMARQRKISQMKRFRREAMARKVQFSEDDKRTMVS